MFQAAAAFSAGLLAQSSVQTTCSQAPSCSASPTDGGTPFKLSVRVHAASVPALGEPGRMVRLKMRLGVGFAGADKETEDADFAGPARSSAWFTFREENNPSRGTTHRAGSWPSSTRGDCAAEFSPGTRSERSCGSSASTSAETKGSSTSGADWASWRFGDTLTFAARTCDLLGGGMRLRLRVQSDVCLGPLQVQFPHTEQDLGEAVVDLRKRVLPASVASWSAPPFLGGAECEFDCPPSWETPALVFPLSHVSDSPHGGMEVNVLGKVAISFSLNTDPEALMREADQAEMPLTYKVADSLFACMQTPLAPLAVCGVGARDGEIDGAPWGSDVAWSCGDEAVTPRPRPRKQLAQQPVLPGAPPAVPGVRMV